MRRRGAVVGRRRERQADFVTQNFCNVKCGVPSTGTNVKGVVNAAFTVLAACINRANNGSCDIVDVNLVTTKPEISGQSWSNANRCGGDESLNGLGMRVTGAIDAAWTENGQRDSAIVGGERK